MDSRDASSSALLHANDSVDFQTVGIHVSGAGGRHFRFAVDNSGRPVLMVSLTNFSGTLTLTDQRQIRSPVTSGDSVRIAATGAVDKLPSVDPAPTPLLQSSPPHSRIVLGPLASATPEWASRQEPAVTHATAPTVAYSASANPDSVAASRAEAPTVTAELHVPPPPAARPPTRNSRKSATHSRAPGTVSVSPAAADVAVDLAKEKQSASAALEELIVSADPRDAEDVACRTREL